MNDQLDPRTLPYVALSELRYLPSCAGIYFAIEHSGEVAYIGQSFNICRRWRSHPVAADLCEVSDLSAARRIRVAWLTVENPLHMDELERAFIRRFRPRLNDTYNRDPKQKPSSVKLGPSKPRNYATKRAYMDKFKVLTPRALSQRALVLAEQLMNPRRVSKPTDEEHCRATVGYIWLDDQGVIRRARTMHLEPILREHGYIERARRILLGEYTLVEQLPAAKRGAK